MVHNLFLFVQNVVHCHSTLSRHDSFAKHVKIQAQNKLDEIHTNNVHKEIKIL